MLLKGKKALILGIANERSLAYGIAKEFQKYGASLGITYLNEQMEKRVAPIAEELGADFICEMDVTKEEQFGLLKEKVEKEWGKFDIIVHSLAFAEREELKKPFHQVSEQGYLNAINISAFSLVKICDTLKPLLNESGSVMAMTYQGSVKICPGYNVMGVAKSALESSMRYLAFELGESGVRVNCLSAGPIRTLASSAVKGVRDLYKVIEEGSPLRRNVNIEDVGRTATFLASDLSSGVTGQTIYVDSGMSVMAH